MNSCVAASEAVAPAKPAWRAVYSLGLGVFGLITAEFLPASLLTPMAASLGVSEGMAGQAVTATALVVNASNKVEQRQLETGDTYGDKWLVLSGLKAGDKLIVEGTDKVAAGQEVKAEEMKASGGNA